MTYLAFRNPDGSRAVIMVNEGGESRKIVFDDGTRVISTAIPARAVKSLIWK